MVQYTNVANIERYSGPCNDLNNSKGNTYSTSKVPENLSYQTTAPHIASVLKRGRGKDPVRWPMESSVSLKLGRLDRQVNWWFYKTFVTMTHNLGKHIDISVTTLSEWEASPPHYLPMFTKCLCHQLTCFNFKLLPNDLVSLAAQTRSLVHRFNTIWQLNTQLSPISPTTPGRCRSKDSIKSTSTVELEVKPVQSRSLAKLPPYSTRTTTLTRPV